MSRRGDQGEVRAQGHAPERGVVQAYPETAGSLLAASMMDESGVESEGSVDAETSSPRGI